METFKKSVWNTIFVFLGYCRSKNSMHHNFMNLCFALNFLLHILKKIRIRLPQSRIVNHSWYIVYYLYMVLIFCTYQQSRDFFSFIVKLDLSAMLVFMAPNSWVIHEIINLYISGCDSIQGTDFLEFSWPMKSMYIVSWTNMAHI